MNLRNKVIENLIKIIFFVDHSPEFTSVKHLKYCPSMNLQNTRKLAKSTICLPSSAII